MHAKADPRRTRFLTNLRSFIFEERTEQEFHRLFQASLPQALLDIAAHPELYNDFRTNGVSNLSYGLHLPDETALKFDNWCKDYVRLLLTCLYGLVGHASGSCEHRGHKAGSHALWTKHVSQHLPLLWSVLADHPLLIILDGSTEVYPDCRPTGDDSGYRIWISRLLGAYYDFQEEE